jgi:secondary thiamine-phosphate synthase enzyme
MRLSVTTHRKREVIDLTPLLSEQLPSGNGVLHIFTQHTQAAVALADLDPGTDVDLLDALDNLIPKLQWRHPHNPSHTPDHLLASLTGPSLGVPFEQEQFLLGTWQRIILIEFDGPRDRQIILTPLPGLAK